MCQPTEAGDADRLNRVNEILSQLWEAANELSMSRGHGVLSFEEFRAIVLRLLDTGRGEHGTPSPDG